MHTCEQSWPINKWKTYMNLFKKLVDALKIFDHLYPNCVGVFLFDQSSAHGAFADDVLVAKHMNVNSGGKNSKPMHSTSIPMDNRNPLPRSKHQYMVFPDGHELAGKPKGMKIILEECELLGTIDCNKNGQPIGICASCKQSEAARMKAEKEAQDRMNEDSVFYGSLGMLFSSYHPIMLTYTTYIHRGSWI